LIWLKLLRKNGNQWVVVVVVVVAGGGDWLPDSVPSAQKRVAEQACLQPRLPAALVYSSARCPWLS